MDKQDDTAVVDGAIIAYDPALFPTLLDQDPEAVRARFARRFAAAGNIDDLFDALEGNTAQGLVGRSLEIRAVGWAPYESERGIIPNAICEAVDVKTGEVLEFATTSDALVLFIRQAELVKALPFRAKIAKKTTRSGNTALNFERV